MAIMKGLVMDRDYANATIAKQPSLGGAIQSLLDTVHALTVETSALSELIHGTQGNINTSGLGAAGPIAVQGWADDLRDAAVSARVRAESAIKEIHRIRETLGL